MNSMTNGTCISSKLLQHNLKSGEDYDIINLSNNEKIVFQKGM